MCISGISSIVLFGGYHDSTFPARELHWFNQNPSNRSSIFASRLCHDSLNELSTIGLYGHAVEHWPALEIDDTNFEVITMRSMGIPIELTEVYRFNYSTARIVDIDSEIRRVWSDHVYVPSNINPNIEWLSLYRYSYQRQGHNNIGPISYLRPHTFVDSGAPKNVLLPANDQLIEIDLRYHGSEGYHARLSRYPNLERVKIFYGTDVNVEQTPSPWAKIPNMMVLHLYGPGLRTYRDNFHTLRNLRELKINVDYMNSLISSTIYRIESLERLILYQPTLDDVLHISLRHISARFVIEFDELVHSSSAEIIEFLSNNSEFLTDDIIYSLMKYL